MRHWTLKERLKQRQLIRLQKPWLWSTGARTLKGKAISRMNAYKYGGHTEEMRKTSRLINEYRRSLNAIG